MWLNICWHKWDYTQEMHFTGGLSLRITDGMLMAKTWTDKFATCSKCGVRRTVIDDVDSELARQVGDIPTGTKINIAGLKLGINGG